MRVDRIQFVGELGPGVSGKEHVGAGGAPEEVGVDQPFEQVRFCGCCHRSDPPLLGRMVGRLDEEVDRRGQLGERGRGEPVVLRADPAHVDRNAHAVIVPRITRDPATD